MAPHANREDVVFNDDAADALIAIFDKVSSTLENQTTSRSQAVSGAMKDFKGYFSQVFNRNSIIGANDASALITAYSDAAQQVRTIKESAHREQENREKAREWEDRDFIDKGVDWLQNKQQPQDTEPEPNFSASSKPAQEKEVPALGTMGDNGGVSSAVPTNLRDARKTLTGLDNELPTYISVNGKLDTFQLLCKWGTFDASSVMGAYQKWLDSNSNEQKWLDDVAQAFEDAGSTSDNPQSLSNEALARLSASGANREDLDIKSPTVTGASPSSGFANDPVNAATGNFVEYEEDIVFADASEALTFSRMYNSLAAEESGVFGAGWSSILDAQLIIDDEKASWVQSDGRHVIFSRQGEGWNRATGYPYWLSLEPSISDGSSEENNEQVLVVRDNEGAWWSFTPTGTWLSQGNGEDTILRSQRDDQGRICRIEHRWNRFIEIEYSNGLVAYIQSSDGTRVDYFYQHGNLIEAKKASGSRRYAYNDAGFLSKVTAADGTVEVENTFNAKGQVVEQTTEFGRQVRYVYLAGGITVVSDLDGENSNSWVSDSRGRLVGLSDAAGNSQSMAYDTFGNRVSVTERDGSMSVRAFDKRGRITRSRSAEGADFTYGWDEQDRVTQVMTASGGLIEYEYEGASRNPSWVKDALGGRTAMVWEKGLLASVTGPTGVQINLGYNSFGELTSLANSLGNTATFVRDRVGRIIQTIQPSGAKTAFAYDGAGNLVSRTDPDGAITRFSYGAGGQLLSVTAADGGVTTFEYGAHGQIVSMTDSLGHITARDYDVMGYVRSLNLPGGASWNFDYDTQGELTQAVNPLGGRWSYEYSVLGEVSAVVDPTGVRTTRANNRSTGVETISDTFSTFTAQYDPYGKLIKETNSDGSEEIYTHDLAGNVVEILDAEGGLTRIERDIAGAITAVISPEGRTTTYTYDSCGRPETQTEPTGEKITLTYDEDSRVVQRASSTGAVETYAYDACGRVIEHRASTGSRTRLSYDKCGRVTFVADGKYGQRRFSYDAAGQMVCATNGLGGKTRYEYTPTGQVASVTDPTGAVTRYEYDAADQLVRATDALGRVTSFAYDAAGRRTEMVDAEKNTHAFAYDGAGLMCERSFNGEKRTGWVRDVAARTVHITDYTGNGAGDGSALNTHTLTYNRLGALVSHESSAGVRSWAYNRDGDRVGFRHEGVQDSYSYTDSGLLAAIQRTALSAPAEGGDGESGVLESVSYAYTAEGVLSSITGTDGRVLFASETVPTGVPDDEGTTGTEDSSADAEHASADSGRWVADGGYAQVTSRADSATGEMIQTTRYFDADGLMIGMDDSVDGLRLFVYDDAHQLIGVRSSAGTHSFVYSAAGFLVAETFPDGSSVEYSYDAAGQLVSKSASDGSAVEYVFDGLGRRVRQVCSDGSVVEFAFDELDQLVGLSAAGAGDSAHADAAVVSLVRDPLGQLTQVAGVPISLDSAEGSVPLVAGIGGVPVPLSTLVAGLDLSGARGVDPFGGSVSVFGSEASSSVADGVFSFTDADVSSLVPSLAASTGVCIGGLEVLGARVYDPATRGFLSRDPLVSPTGAGWASNVYAFAGFDPVGLVDPWGLSPVSREEFAQYAAEHPSGIAATTKNIGKGIADFVDRNAGWIALGVAAVGVIALTVSGPIGWGILGGMAISGGMEIGTQLLSGQPMDWKKVAKSASIGGIAGGFGAGAAGVVTKVGSKLLNGRSTSLMGRASQIGSRADEAASWGTRFGNNLAGRYSQSKVAVERAAQRWSSWGNRVSSSPVKAGVGAYSEAGMDTSLTYITEGHEVTPGGLAASWGVPAVSNALVPKPVSDAVGKRLKNIGWEASGGFSAKARDVVSDGVGNFSNGVVSYSGAPMTYAPKFEEYQEPGYEGPGWDVGDAFKGGVKEVVKSGVSNSSAMESVRGISLEPNSSGGLDYSGMARDASLLTTGASEAGAAGVGIYEGESEHHGK